MTGANLLVAALVAVELNLLRTWIWQFERIYRP
jgi:hypothetical protein